MVAGQDEAGALAVELVEMAVPPTGGPIFDRRRERADAALEALAGLWERLPDEARDLAVRVGEGRWSEAIRGVLRRSQDPVETRGAILLAAGLGDPELAAALVSGLDHGDAAAVRAAEIGLLGMSLRARGIEPERIVPEIPEADLGVLRGPPIDGAVARAALDTHLADAGWAFGRHQRRLVLIAALASLDLSGLSAARRDQSGASGPARLLRLVQESSHGSHRALRQILRWSACPLVRGRALLLLSEPAIAAAALERVSRSESADEHRAVLEAAHLALRPARRRLLSMVRVRIASGAGRAAMRRTIAPGQVLPDPAAWARIGEQGRRGAALLAGLVEADDEARSRLMEDALSDGDEPLRLRAVSVLARSQIGDYCLDERACIARSALLRWSGAGLGVRGRAEPGERARLSRLLTRSPHASVRALAWQDVSRETPWRPGSAASRCAAWRLALRERDHFLGRLRALVREGLDRSGADGSGRWGRAGGGSPDAIAAIGVARRLDLCRLITPELAELVDPGRAAAPRVAATAAAALGDVGDAVSRGALRRALEHPDARVRANAVEAMGSQRLTVEDATTGRDRDYGVLVELRGDPHHRVRANAIRALLRLPPACPRERRARRGSVVVEAARMYEPAAVEALTRMLADGRPEHRLAGAWLAGRVLPGGRSRVGEAWAGLSTRIVEMGTADPEGAVRARASLASRRISSAVRARWGGRSAEVAGSIGPEGDAAGTGLEPAEPAGMAG